MILVADHFYRKIRIIVSGIGLLVRSVSLFVLPGILFNCSDDKQRHQFFIEGQAQGTTYHITWFSDNERISQQQVDSLLQQLDRSLSTYVPQSVISRINRNEQAHLDLHFENVFNRAQQISDETDGAFDITVAPLINAYGFGFTNKSTLTPLVIDSLRKFIGYRMVKLQGDTILKQNDGVQLDFNAIAQGYSVDVIASFLEERSVERYLIELGGEVRAKGTKENGESWKVGIDSPEDSFDSQRNLNAVVKLDNRAMATSGNYRRFYEENGTRYAHIIDPKTGYPAMHNLLSATVFANDCMTADAYATAFMVMGVEGSKEFLAARKDLDLDVFFIYNENEHWATYSSENLVDILEDP